MKHRRRRKRKTPLKRTRSYIFNFPHCISSVLATSQSARLKTLTLISLSSLIQQICLLLFLVMIVLAAGCAKDVRGGQETQGKVLFVPPPRRCRPKKKIFPNTIKAPSCPVPQPLKKTGEPHPEVLGAEFGFNGTDKLSQSP